MRGLKSLFLAISIFRSRDFINIRKDRPRKYPTTENNPELKPETYVTGHILPFFKNKNINIYKTDDSTKGSYAPDGIGVQPKDL